MKSAKKGGLVTNLNNLISIIKIVNMKISKIIPEKPNRNDWKSEDFESALNSMTEVKNDLVRLIKAKQNEAKKKG